MFECLCSALNALHTCTILETLGGSFMDFGISTGDDGLSFKVKILRSLEFADTMTLST